MKFINKSVWLIPCLVLGLMSSCDFLSVDKYFDDTLKYDSVFSNNRNLEKDLWGAAGELPDERYLEMTKLPVLRLPMIYLR